MKKFFIFLLLLCAFILVGAGCKKGAPKPSVEGAKQKLEQGVKEAAESIAASKQLTMKQALQIAEARAKEWSANAKPTRVISGPDIKENGQSGYWEFKFRIPGDKESLFRIETQGGKIIETEEKKIEWHDQTPLPENSLDSDKLYKRSYEEFQKLHPADFGDYKISLLGFQCADTAPLGKELSKFACYLTFNKEKQMATGATVDPVTGEFVEEIK